MVGRARLTVRPAFRFAGVVAIVIALHAWAIDWLARALESPALLKPMAAPMFTRLLKPEAPLRSETFAAMPKRAQKRTTLAAIAPPAAKLAAKPASAAASAPESAASAARVATSAPQPVAQTSAPVAAASAPQPSASQPSASASASANTDASLDSWPVDTRLSYRLTGWYRGELTGGARVQWLRQKDRYETRVDLDLGVIGYQFLSQGDVAGDSLSPRAYQESTPGRTRVVQLSPDNVVLNDGRTVARPAGVQDTASQFVELSHRFSTGKDKLVVGGATGVWLARPGGVDFWTYEVVGRDLLPTPQLGAVEAFHLKPRPIANPRGNIYAEIWLAPALQYLPVRIRLTQGPDSFVDILVEKIEQR